MKCPECGKELKFVHVYSQCCQRGRLKCLQLEYLIRNQ